jgi:hypothetical protein
MTKRFEVGKTYSDSFTGDSQLFAHFPIKARTAQTITTVVDGKTVKRRLYVYEGVEQFKPFGNYSMAMIVNANDSDLSQSPNPEQLQAVQAFAAKYATKSEGWKEHLITCWMNGADAREPDGHLLRQVRNQFGPQWLKRWK